MIDYERQRERKRQERKRRPEETREQARMHKRAQRERAMAEVDTAMQAANSAWVRAGIRGTPWTRQLRSSLRTALEAAERYAVVR